ncbi:MAG: M48 family metalloprotease [Frankia sp.]|nr:M48 family metalloprotease [Frankia sp.]
MLLLELALCAVAAPIAGAALMTALADRVRAAVSVVAFTVSACLLALGTVLVLLAGAIHTATAVLAAGRDGWGVDALLAAARDSWLSAPCLLAGMVVAVSAARVAWAQRRALRAARAQAAALPGDEAVVVVPGAKPEAFTLPGSPGRIVVTEPMRAALTPADYAVLVAHERAHLVGRHYRFVNAARLAAAAQPLLRPVARLVEYGVERWADEQAADAVGGNRRRVAHAIGAAALLASARATGGAPARPASALGIAASSRQQDRPGPVPRRVRALLNPLPGASRVLLLAAPAAVSVGSFLWAGDVIYDAHIPLRLLAGGSE